MIPAFSNLNPALGRRIGLALTLIWLAVVLYLVIGLPEARFGLEAVTGLVVLGLTPVALLWLLWAVVRHSRTLRVIQGQLHLQIEETQRLVVQQKRLVEDYRAQQKRAAEDLLTQRAKELQASRPLLEMKAVGNSGVVQGRNIVHFALLNHGRTCTKIRLSFGNGHDPQQFNRLPDGGELPFKLALPAGIVEPLVVTVSYLDQQLHEGSKRFRISGGESSFQVEPMAEANAG